MVKPLNLHHGRAAFGGLTHFCNAAYNQELIVGRFGRLFPKLPALYTDPAILDEIGGPGGPMDGGTQSNPSSSIDVGHVFFGQFVDHDITLDTGSSLSRVNTPSEITNIRTPTLDLDCIYGDGPEGSPYLYRDHIYLVTGADDPSPDNTPNLAKRDLARAPNGRALIGDPRNDENRIVSQIQLAFHRFHNNVVDYVKNNVPHITTEAEIFEEARQIVTDHYHWALLYDFLPTICGGDIVQSILHEGRKYYCVKIAEPFIPVEFSVAGFRFGHTVVPQSIQTQKNGSRLALFGPKLGTGFTKLSDKDAEVDMLEMFEVPGSGRTVQKAERMDAKLAETLINLPAGIATDPSSLATRNLLRGQSFMMPSGEAISRAMGIDESIIETVSNSANADVGGKLNNCTPLWFYMLKEAEIVGRQSNGSNQPGEGLGPMGGRLVAEVMIGLMELDPRSFLARNRSWTPADGLGASVNSVGTMLTYS